MGEENYLEWKKIQDGFIVRLFNSVSTFQFFIIICMISFYILFWDKFATQTKTFFGVLIFLVLIFFVSKSKINMFITEPQAKEIVRESLKKKIGNELPTGTEIFVGPYCNPEKGKWKVQIKLKYPNGLTKDGMVKVNLYGGKISGIIYMPTGYTGTEDTEKDKIKPVFVQKFKEVE